MILEMDSKEIDKYVVKKEHTDNEKRKIEVLLHLFVYRPTSRIYRVLSSHYQLSECDVPKMGNHIFMRNVSTRLEHLDNIVVCYSYRQEEERWDSACRESELTQLMRKGEAQTYLSSLH